jgi:hypothetical protein
MGNSFNTLFLEISENLTSDKKHLNNNFFLEADEDDEVSLDTDVDLGTGKHNDNVGAGDSEISDTEGTEGTDEGTGEADGTDTGEGEGIETPGDGTEEGAIDGGDGTTAEGEGTNPDGTEQEGLDNNASSADPNQSKKIVLFKNYRSIYNVTNQFIEKVADFKEYAESDELKKKNYETIEFIEDKLNILKDNLKLMLIDKISTMDYEKSKTIFVHVKSEVNLLLNLFNKISNTK